MKTQFLLVCRSAFSLLELLVVTVITGILTAILLSAVARSKASARLIQCQSNLRQIGVALNEFGNDYGVFPLSANPKYPQGEFPEHLTGWWHALNEHYIHQPMFTNNLALTQNGVFDCPGVSQPADWPASWDFSDYGYNGNGLGGGGSNLGLGGMDLFSDSIRPTRVGEVRSPCAMLALGDGLRGWQTVIQDGSGLLERSKVATLAPDRGGTARTLRRHNGRVSVLFTEGHTEALNLKRLFEDNSDDALSQWNKDHEPHRDKVE